MKAFCLRQWGIALLCFFSLETGMVAATFPASNSFLQIEGRAMITPEGGVRIGFPGVVVRMHLKTDKLVLRCSANSDTLYLNLNVDGGPAKVINLAKGEQNIVLFEGPPGIHLIELTKRTESWQGVLELHSLEAEHAQWLAPEPLPSRRVLFIGDSITCGAGAAAGLADTSSGAEMNDACLSYGYLLSRRVGAQCHLVSYGGRGIIRDWRGIRDIANAPQFYEYALPDEPIFQWDSKSYVPDLVGICLGTNDFNQGIPDENEFINTYVELVRKVRRDAPEAYVLLMDSPMLQDAPLAGPKRSVLAHYLDEVVRRVASPKVMHVPIPHYPGRPSNSHPIGTEHAAIAGHLESTVRRLLAW